MNERSAYEQAQDVVLKAEDAWFIQAMLDLHEAQHVAESCGCPNCRKRAIGQQERVEREIERLQGPPKIARSYQTPSGKEIEVYKSPYDPDDVAGMSK